MAWQYHDPLTGKGFVQSFRRESCQESLIKLRLSGLNPDAVYVVRNPDSGTSEQMTGKQLTEVGLAVSHPTPRSAVILIYRQL
jgi:hypothetical protein